MSAEVERQRARRRDDLYKIESFVFIKTNDTVPACAASWQSTMTNLNFSHRGTQRPVSLSQR